MTQVSLGVEVSGASERREQRASQAARPSVGLLIPDLSPGGAERVATNLVRTLERDWDPELLLMGTKVAYEASCQTKIIGADFVRPAPRVIRGARFVGAAARLIREKRSRGYDVCLSFMTLANLLNVATPFDGRRVISVHNRESVYLRTSGRISAVGAARAAYRRADGVVAVSEGVAEDLVRHFRVRREQITVIPNALDLEAIAVAGAASLPLEWAGFLAHPTILAVGRLVEQKGPWHLVRILADVKRSEPNARLLFLGRGPLRARLARLGRELGLRVWDDQEDGPDGIARADIAFIKYHANPFMFMKACSVFAFPSLWEGFGNVALEALAVGAPVFLSDCIAGPREILGLPGQAGSAKSVTQNGVGTLLPVPEGLNCFRAGGLAPVERLWSDAILQALRGSVAGDRAAREARAAKFDMHAQLPLWNKALLG